MSKKISKSLLDEEGEFYLGRGKALRQGKQELDQETKDLLYGEDQLDPRKREQLYENMPTDKSDEVWEKVSEGSLRTPAEQRWIKRNKQ